MKPDYYANVAARPGDPTPDLSFETLTQTIAENLSQAESLVDRLRGRLIGGNSLTAAAGFPPAQPSSVSNEPTLDYRLHDFSERTFALHQELSTILGRVTS